MKDHHVTKSLYNIFFNVNFSSKYENTYNSNFHSINGGVSQVSRLALTFILTIKNLLSSAYSLSHSDTYDCPIHSSIQYTRYNSTRTESQVCVEFFTSGPTNHFNRTEIIQCLKDSGKSFLSEICLIPSPGFHSG